MLSNANLQFDVHQEIVFSVRESLSLDIPGRRHVDVLVALALCPVVKIESRLISNPGYSNTSQMNLYFGNQCAIMIGNREWSKRMQD